MSARASISAAATLTAIACSSPSLNAVHREPPSSGALCETLYTDPAQQTPLGAGDRSHWLQPWRSYSETWPAERLRDGLGVHLGGADVTALVPLLARAGLTRMATEFQWAGYDEAAGASGYAGKYELLKAIVTNGGRPTLFVDAINHRPCPHADLQIVLAEPAARGSTQVRLTADAVRAVVPGKTGFFEWGPVREGDPLIVSVTPDGTAVLSKPISVDVAAGPQHGFTLKYEPFGRPRLTDGQPNPRFEATIAGWLQFVRAVVSAARDAIGADAFDVDVMNGARSAFLRINSYYDPPLAEEASGTLDETRVEIMRRTAEVAKREGGPGVRVFDGITRLPWTGASVATAGVDGIEREVAVKALVFPDAAGGLAGRSLDAVGMPNGMAVGDGTWREAFSPRYRAAFPELALTAVGPNQLVPDLTPQARQAGPAIRLPATSFNFGDAVALEPGFSKRDSMHLQAKALLRAAVAYIGSGVDELLLYTVFGEAAATSNIALYEPASPETSEPLAALGRLRTPFAGGTVRTARKLRLRSIAGCLAGQQEFAGDGTAAHPSLTSRDVTAFFPFQVADDHFVAAAYVMTRDMTRRYGQDDPTALDRYDLPPSTVTLVLEGVRASRAVVTASDPLRGIDVPVTVTARTGDRLTIELPLTDSPRLIDVKD